MQITDLQAVSTLRVLTTPQRAGILLALYNRLSRYGPPPSGELHAGLD